MLPPTIAQQDPPLDSSSPVLFAKTARTDSTGESAPFNNNIADNIGKSDNQPVPEKPLNIDSVKGEDESKPARVSKAGFEEKQAVFILRTEKGFSIVKKNITINQSYNQTNNINNGQQIKVIEQERKERLNEIISVLTPQISIVAPNNTGISEESLNNYVRALNEQTKELKEEIKGKISPTDEVIATEVVNREISKKIKEKANSEGVSKNEIAEEMKSIDGFASKESVEKYINNGESNFFRRVYIIIKEGMKGQQQMMNSLAEYSSLVEKKDRITIDNDTKNFIDKDVSPEEVLSIIYKVG